MTETEWAECDDPERCLFAVAPAVTSRKVTLFLTACCRRLGNALRHPSVPRLIEHAERLADGAGTVEELLVLLDLAVNAHGDPRLKGRNHPDRPGHIVLDVIVVLSRFSLGVDARPGRQLRSVRTPLRELQNQLAHIGRRGSTFGAFDEALWVEERAEAAILRDLVPHPSEVPSGDPAWRTSPAVALASQMYETRDFGAMPILADALQEAGCDHDDILAHCRDPHAAHVRGCWVVDLVLGKA